MKHLAAAALSAALVLPPAPALAQPDPPAHAQTAARLANAIHAGDDLSKSDEMLRLLASEYDELARLEACDGAVQPALAPTTVIVYWTCGPQTRAPGLVRTTAMVFNPDGHLHFFAINQSLDALTVSPAAAAMEGTNTHTFAMRFAKAVRRGEDPGLGETLSLSALDRARLAQFKGGETTVLAQRTQSRIAGVKTIQRVRLKTKKGKDQRVAYLYFDPQDRPMGLIFAPARNPQSNVARPLNDGKGYETHQENRRRQQGRPGCVFC